MHKELTLNTLSSIVYGVNSLKIALCSKEQALIMNDTIYIFFDYNCAIFMFKS